MCQQPKLLSALFVDEPEIDSRSSLEETGLMTVISQRRNL